MNDQNNNQSFDDKVKLDQQAFEAFIDQLIKDKNSPYVTDQNREEVRTQLMQDLTASINRKMVSLLSNEKVQELNSLLDKNVSDQELSEFFAANIPNIEQELSHVLIDFRNGYLSVAYPPSSGEVSGGASQASSVGAPTPSAKPPAVSDEKVIEEDSAPPPPPPAPVMPETSSNDLPPSPASAQNELN